jgi:Ca2+-binding RTX toxin-like protein
MPTADNSFSIDEQQLGHIRIDGITRTNPSGSNPDPVSLVRDSLGRLNSDPALHNFLIQIDSLLAGLKPGGAILKITTADIDKPALFDDFAHAQGGYVPTGGSYNVLYGDNSGTNSGKNAYEAGDALIYLEARDSTTFPLPIIDKVENSFSGSSADGYVSDFSMTLDRVLMHELVHILTNSTNTAGYSFGFDATLSNSASLRYSEDMAVMAENFLYVPYATSNSRTDSQLRLGHTTNQDPGGSSGIDAFSKFSLGRAITPSGAQGDPITFSASRAGIGGSTDLVLKYYETGHAITAGVSSYSYDHYMKYELKNTASSGSLYSFNGSAVSVDAAFADVLADALVQPLSGDPGYQHLLDPAKTALDALHSIVPHISKTAVTNVFLTSGIPQIRPNHFEGLDRMVALSAERFTNKDSESNVVDVTGPSLHGNTTPATVLAIDESSSNTGTLIFGGSGFDFRYHQATNLPDAAKASFGSSTDFIIGTSASDVIVLGTGIGQNAARNTAHGGDGHDILIGRSADDALHGEAGDDILIGGSGNNILDGGADYDLVSYAHADAGVFVNLNSQTAYRGWAGTGDQGTDTLSFVEGVIGSIHADTLHGRGGSLLIGGEGNDIFYLKSGDIAIGGGGNDTFYLMDQGSSSGPARYAILDLNSEDTMTPWSFYGTGMVRTHFDTSDPNEPGRISIITGSGSTAQPGNPTWPGMPGIPGTGGVTGPGQGTPKYEIFVSDLQESDWGLSSRPYAEAPPGIGPMFTATAYSFDDLFGLIPMI